MSFFKVFFLIFLEIIPCKELVFFLYCIQCIMTLLLSYQNSFQTIFQIFHYKGNPSDLGGIQISLSQSIEVLQSKLNMFCDQGVKYYTKQQVEHKKKSQKFIFVYIYCTDPTTIQWKSWFDEV